MRTKDALLAGWALLLVLAALLAPGLAQPPDAHAFADQRAFWGLPCALDVLSNLPLAIAGGFGLVLLRRRADLGAAQLACARLFCAGLVITAAGSAFYHWAPDDFGLAIDRTAMSIAFAGLLGLAAAAGVSERAGRATAVALLLLGPAAVAVWYATGNVLPWALVQFGGMPVLLALVFAPPRPGALPVRWGAVLLLYALAKWFELNDHAVFAASGQLFSGHTLKHVVAALAALPVLAAVAAPGRRQNGPASDPRPLADGRGA
ncbi:MAG TPA: hypothetical protein VLK85_27170 [Ramlibacter sp.]|nr:hypothetical protein [Ramlibacter sp.]